MVKLDTEYNDEAATADDGGNFAPSFGVFDATIVDISPPRKDTTEFEVKKSKQGKPHYSARYAFTYKNADGEEKTKYAFISCIGLWFTPLTKSLLIATESDNAEDRAALMKDTAHLKGKKVQIVIGAKEKGDYGDRKTFEGYEVGEWEDKIFIANEVLEFVEMGKKVVFDMDAEKSLRARFKDAEHKTDEAVPTSGQDSAYAKEVDKDF